MVVGGTRNFGKNDAWFNKIIWKKKLLWKIDITVSDESVVFQIHKKMQNEY
jgi:hypothetical protein